MMRGSTAHRNILLRYRLYSIGRPAKKRDKGSTYQSNPPDFAHSSRCFLGQLKGSALKNAKNRVSVLGQKKGASVLCLQTGGGERVTLVEEPNHTTAKKPGPL